MFPLGEIAVAGAAAAAYRTYSPAVRVKVAHENVEKTRSLNQEAINMVSTLSPTDQEDFQNVHHEKQALFE